MFVQSSSVVLCFLAENYHVIVLLAGIGLRVSLDLSILIAISDPCMISSFMYERIDVVTDLM